MAFPPFVIATLGGVAAAAVAKLAVNEWRRVNAVLHPQEPIPVKETRPQPLPTLRRDPRTGIYRPD
jgi:hypothetical protein